MDSDVTFYLIKTISPWFLRIGSTHFEIKMPLWVNKKITLNYLLSSALMKPFDYSTEKYSESCISKHMLFSQLTKDTEVITSNFGPGDGNQHRAGYLSTPTLQL